MALPSIDATGNLCGDPELRYTNAQVPFVKLRLACNERKKDGDKWVDGRTTYLDVVAWRDLAEQAANTLVKGEKVRVTGRLTQSEYTTKDGEKRTGYELSADGIYRGLVAVPAQPDRGPASSAFDEEPF